LPVWAGAVKLPDLYVFESANSFSPVEVKQGGVLKLDYTIANNGTLCIPGPCDEVFGPAYGPWEEAVIIYKSQTPDAEFILLGTIPFTGVLNPMEEHRGQADFQVPADLPPGKYRVIVHGDYVSDDPNGRVLETDEENNREILDTKLTILERAVILYVDDDGALDPGAGDPNVSDPCESGSSEHPFDSIQEAIDVSFDGDTVLVADGTYTGDGNRDIDFRGKAITVRSENGPATCIIDCNGTRSDPRPGHGGFYFHSGEGADSVVSGFTITNGGASAGSGIFCSEASPTIENNIIAGNTAYVGREGGGDGGGVYCYEASPVIVDNLIMGNVAGGSGGGIYANGSSVLLINNTLTANHARGTRFPFRSPGRGGAICCVNSSFLTVVNCTVIGNKAHDLGGAWEQPGEGGAVFHRYSSLTVVNSILRANKPDEIFSDSGQPTDDVTYSNVEGGWPGQGNIDGDPCFAGPGYWDENSTPDDANDDFWVEGDYHLKSQGGRWDSKEGRWTTDDVTSPCIDGGDPMSPVGAEAFPNGGIVNMGAYGGTAQGSKSYFGKAGCETVMAGDVNGDCAIDFRDLELMSLHWCEDNNP
jgi:predicted outer membrane repeat protein